MTMDVSTNFQSRGLGGYGYICIPWVNKNQWHAFSLFENPINPTQRQIFVQSTTTRQRKKSDGGNNDSSSSSSSWTGQVLNVLQGRNTVRPVYIQGPYPSPYEQSTKYDNMILVASGIGITPALSAIRAFKSSRRVNLIWSVRDKYLLEFMLRQMYLDDDGWNLIFYTGRVRYNSERHSRWLRAIVCF